MLILTRRVGETLMIGDSVTVTILGVKGNQVRVGITAPKDVAVHREEIFQRIGREAAAQGGEPPAEDPGLPKAGCEGILCGLPVLPAARETVPGEMPEWPKGLPC